MDQRTRSAEHERVVEFIRQKDASMPLPIDPQHSVLLVVDMQRLFVRREYPFGQACETLMPRITDGYFERVQQSVVPNIQRLQAACREQQVPIFYTAIGCYLPDGRDLPGWLKAFDQAGLAVLGTRVWPLPHDQSWEIDDSVAPLPGEVVLHKTTSGAFASTGLDHTLRNMGVETVIVTGLTSEVCVTQAARAAADLGYQALVVEDACTAFSEEMHGSALLAFNIAFGRVRTTDETLALLGAARLEAVPA